ncbi:F-box only protein 5 [Simochromis diagramma]|uniref:F-box only protein 5 n=1 Tax=Simochromis diagramma TaxID=43689 RepID=UPI001A7EB6C5|nr:F-box only protein 5 [Simochromis diagramma]
MSHSNGIIMKFAACESPRASAVEAKASPVKEPIPIKPQCSPVKVTTVLFSSKNNTSAIHDKENSTGMAHDRTLEFEDSGYLSLQNSQIEYHHENEEDVHILGKSTVVSSTATNQGMPRNSPSKCQVRSTPIQLEAVCTPVVRPQRRTAAYSSSTPSGHHSDSHLPILNFQRVVCEELAKSYEKNKRYDWSIVTKVAENFLLDRVIGRQMGLEYSDIFQSLLARNMRCILTKILAFLEDLDLISCKKVSRTWRKIICEDAAALRRCQRAEQELRESRNSLRQRDIGLTRDVAVSRMVLSCMQTTASSKTPSSSSSSSTPSCMTTRRAAASQRGSTPTSRCSRFNEYIQAASTLKRHESLRACKRCGSPATHLNAVQKATCTRLSCLFTFCTRCQESFHGSTPCRTVTPRANFSKTSPGSARSKKNIRRL